MDTWFQDENIFIWTFCVQSPIVWNIAALQKVKTNFAKELMAALQSAQPLPLEPSLTILLNELTTISANSVLVLDDYHVIDAEAVNQALTFLIEHLPPQMHLVITTREDPPLPLARLRARGQLTELRAVDLRFNRAEAAEFLNRVTDLSVAHSVASMQKSGNSYFEIIATVFLADIRRAQGRLREAASISRHCNLWRNRTHLCYRERRIYMLG